MNVFMTRAIKLARQNVEAGGGPFGAVIVKKENMIAEGVNRVTSKKDPTAHAEIQAIRAACEKLGTHDLSGCEIYSSCEPCPMCLSAIYWAHISCIYYAASREDAAKAGFDDLYILNEIKLSRENRSIPHVKLLNPETSSPFEAWKDCPDKSKY
ncbi:MAG: nucleoside deaminase [Prolixibacteraceae bacterium]|nr:nucleoside deaminase [Prolixibacteraceae bacterium]